MSTNGTATCSSATDASTGSCAASTIPPSPPPSVSQSVASLGSGPVDPMDHHLNMHHVADWVEKTTGEVPEDPPTVPEWVIDFIYDAPESIILNVNNVTRVGDFGWIVPFETMHNNQSEDFADESLEPNSTVVDDLSDGEIEYEEVSDQEEDRDALAELDELLARGR